MDIFSKKARSKIMSAIKGKNTKPEILVRKSLHSLGHRFRLHKKDLPGKPDIILPKYKVAIFVHGCFWHQHKGCKSATIPTSNVEYWSEKLKKNVERDRKNISSLRRQGYKIKVIWECETSNIKRLKNKLRALLDKTPS